MVQPVCEPSLDEGVDEPTGFVTAQRQGSPAGSLGLLSLMEVLYTTGPAFWVFLAIWLAIAFHSPGAGLVLAIALGVCAYAVTKRRNSATGWSESYRLSGTGNPNTTLRGVGGWLLLMCVLLTVLSPLSWLVFTAKYFMLFIIMCGGLLMAFVPHPLLFAAYFAKHPLPLSLWAFRTPLISTAMLAYGFVAGYRLWRLHPDAVGFAKAFWLVNAIVRALGFVLQSGQSQGQNLFAVALPTCVSLAWWGYLSSSRRVRNTYRQAAPPAPEQEKAGVDIEFDLPR